MHNFDDEVIDEPPPEEIEEDLPPPPPVFSESELEAAKKKAFNEGCAKGISDSKASRDQALADVMQRLSGDMQTLFAAEKAREERYEREVIALCHALFKQAFPAFQEKHGFDELVTQLETILRAQHGQRRIEIRISGDYAQDVETFMNELHAQNSELNFTVLSDDTLETGSFKINWDDGGAIYDTPALAKRILSNLEEMLAGERVPSHNDSSEESNISGENTPHDEQTDNNPIAEDDYDG